VLLSLCVGVSVGLPVAGLGHRLSYDGERKGRGRRHTVATGEDDAPMETNARHNARNLGVKPASTRNASMARASSLQLQPNGAMRIQRLLADPSIEEDEKEGPMVEIEGLVIVPGAVSSPPPARETCSALLVLAKHAQAGANEPVDPKP
jgi:hypothetical protein